VLASCMFGSPTWGGLCARGLLIVTIARRTACALGGVGAEKMVLYTPSETRTKESDTGASIEVANLSAQ